MNKYPKFFYKYRSLGDKFKEDISLITLFDNRAIFTNRKCFNDPFDSKIVFLKASKEDFLFLRNKVPFNQKEKFNQILNDPKELGFYTGDGFIQILNEMLDKHFFYCVSATNNSNLMWSHYANWHKGFCIEFKSEHLQAEKINYQEVIAQINVKDVILASVKEADPEFKSKMTQDIWNALRIKLIEWEYEQEYRFQLATSERQGDSNIIKKQYSSEWLESIIFGCRTANPAKKYIIENMRLKHVNLKFKQAVEDVNTISIRDITEDEIKKILEN